MNLNDISTQLLYTTIPIWIEDSSGNKASGTSFVINKESNGTIPFLITNKHIVMNAKKIIIKMSLLENNMPCRNSRGINIELDLNNFHFHEKNDICVMPLGPIINALQERKTPVFFRAVTSEIIPSKETTDKLSAIEDVIFIGYPSGVYDLENLTPIVRQGITATAVWNDFQKEPKFLIDGGVFPGSSGSPVFILNRGSYSVDGNLAIGNRLMFLGILTSTLLRNEAKQSFYLSLGEVIKGKVINDFLEFLVIKIK